MERRTRRRGKSALQGAGGALQALGRSIARRHKARHALRNWRRRYWDDLDLGLFQTDIRL